MLNFIICYSLFSTLYNFLISFYSTNYTMKSSLLLIAHPDDESMFFSPFLYFNKPYILCLSSGDFDGKGEIRKKELLNLCDCRGLDHKIMNYSDNFDWDANQICFDLILICLKHKIKNIVTFDSFGVSGHKNHISCYKAAKKFEKLDRSKLFRFKYLKSVGIIEKYLCFVRKPTYSIPIYSIFGFENMLFHQSQLVWFRYIYVLISSYMKHVILV